MLIYRKEIVLSYNFNEVELIRVCLQLVSTPLLTLKTSDNHHETKVHLLSKYSPNHPLYSFECAVIGKTTNGNGRKSTPAAIQKHMEYVSLRVKAKQNTKLKCIMFCFTVYGFNLYGLFYVDLT